ncbi:hypothetical protein PVK06_008022 [Gossypium arboreum]|uniref:Retrotransposon gag domain-containing protein n=1 Tax=Gossypium arboreum TaxID=29729 RepID=A0ABR0QIW4_GOSAR|nr:hypothetical protein PVK06_008022 [Gossypium arboreum]
MFFCRSIRTGAREGARAKEAVLGIVHGESNPGWLLVTSRSFWPGLYEPASRMSGHECRLLLQRRSVTGVWARDFMGIPRKGVVMNRGIFLEDLEGANNSLVGKQRNPLCYKKNFFRFEAKWCLDGSFEDVLRRYWNGFSGNVLGKLENLGQQLQRWSNSKDRDIKEYRRKYDERLNFLYNQDQSDDILAKITDIYLGLNLEADQEELYWEQRTRINWLKNSDRNTNFFHTIAVQRNLRGKIKELEGANGEKIYTNEDMLKVASDFFVQLFSASESGVDERVFGLVEKRVTDDMNASLLK